MFYLILKSLFVLYLLLITHIFHASILLHIINFSYVDTNKVFVGNSTVV